MRKKSQLYRGEERRRFGNGSKEKVILDLSLDQRVIFYQVLIPGYSCSDVCTCMYDGGVLCQA